MIRVFGKTDRNFSSNGDIVLRPAKAKVTKKDNGDYYLALEAGLEYVDYFVEGNVVVANTPSGDQAFRIGNVVKGRRKVSSKCLHVFYDARNYLIPYVNISELSCASALTALNGNTSPVSEFTTGSDIVGSHSYECVRKSLHDAVKDVLEIYGGHLVRDNFYIAIKTSIGTDRGIIVQYKKNLKDISVSENWNGVVTKLLPTGKDGIMLNAVDPSASIYVESDTQYDIPYCKTISFTQNIDQNDYPTEIAYKTALVADLLSQAEAYVEANSIPKINYTLKANLDRVADIGDTIEVVDERLGVDLMTSVIGFEYDCIAEKYTQVEFGNFQQTLSGFANSITQTAEKVAETAAESAVESQSDLIKETGTSGGWTWRKYESGAVEAWTQISKASGDVSWSTLITGLSKGSFDVAYPFNIYSPIVTATMDSCTGEGWISTATGASNKATLIAIRTATTDTMKVNITVRGKESA
jgi:phage minor structural protein